VKTSTAVLTVAGILSLTGCTSLSSRFFTAPAGKPGVDLLSLRQRRKQACTVTCLCSVASYWGITKDVEEIQHELGTMPKGGYTLGQLRGWARKNGLMAFVVRGSMEQLQEHTDAGRPTIATIRQRRNRNHSVVVRQVRPYDQRVVVMDPAKGRTLEVEKKWFEDKWQAIGSPMLVLAPTND